MNKSNHPVLTSEELGALLTPRQQQALLGVDLNFRWRHAFLLSFCLAYIVRLFFFPEVAIQYFNFAGEDVGRKMLFLQMRGWVVLAGTLVYLFSYTRDWHFAKVSLVIFAMALSSFVLDLVNIYAFSTEATPKLVTAMILVRLMALYLLLLNALRAERLPPMPRRFYS
jgi:cytochrome c oxidase subunit IV